MSLGADVVDQNPTENTKASSRVSVEGSQHRAHGSVERGTSVEAVPSEPDEDGADENKSGVVGPTVDLFALGQTLSKDERVGKSRPAGCDVNWTSTLHCVSDGPMMKAQIGTGTYSEVKTGKVEQPSVGVPSPACNRAVHDGRPAEGKDHGRHDATTFKRSTDNKLYGTSAEEHLVEAEDNFRKESGAW